MKQLIGRKLMPSLKSGPKVSQHVLCDVNVPVTTPIIIKKISKTEDWYFKWTCFYTLKKQLEA